MNCYYSCCVPRPIIGIAVGGTVVAVVVISIVIVVAVLVCRSRTKHKEKSSRKSIFNKFRSTKRGELFRHPIFISQRQNLCVDEECNHAQTENKKNFTESTISAKTEKSNSKSTSGEDTKGKQNDPDKKADNVPEKKENEYVEEDEKPNRISLKKDLEQVKNGENLPIEVDVLSPETPVNTFGLTANASYGAVAHPRALSTPNLSTERLQINKRASLPIGSIDEVSIPPKIPVERNPSYLHVSQSTSEEEMEECEGDYSYVKSDTIPAFKKKIPKQVEIYIEMEKNHNGTLLTKTSDEDENFYF